jgi:hypothetical protein
MTPGAVPPPPPPDWAATQPPQPPAAPDWSATTPPPTAPGWAYAAPAPTQGSGMGTAVGGAIGRRILGLVGLLVVVGVLAGGAYVYTKVANPNHLGQVLFATDDQSSQSDCTIIDQVSSVKVGTPVYAIYFWQHQLSADQAVKEEDFKDGVSIATYDIPKTDSSDADCLVEQDDLSQSFTTAGTYEIKLTVGTEVVADGKLTITS